MNSDPTGTVPGWIIALIVWGAITLATSIGEIVAYNRSEEVYEQYKEEIVIEDNRVLNSASVTNIFDIWALSMYIRYNSNNETAKGSGFGIFVEWCFHNAGYYLAGMENGKDLDFGKTIFHDYQDHNKGLKWVLPTAMILGELILNPFFTVYDIFRSF